MAPKAPIMINVGAALGMSSSPQCSNRPRKCSAGAWMTPENSSTGTRKSVRLRKRTTRPSPSSRYSVASPISPKPKSNRLTGGPVWLCSAIHACSSDRVMTVSNRTSRLRLISLAAIKLLIDSGLTSAALRVPSARSLRIRAAM